MHSKTVFETAAQPNIQEVSFEYIADLDLYDKEKPYYVNCSAAKHMPGEKETNIETTWHHDVPIEDVRGHESLLSFEKEGFRYIEHNTLLGTRFEEEEVKFDLEEMTEVIRSEVGAEKAFCYDIRTRTKGAARNCELVSEDRAKPVKPVTIAHTDHTKHGGLRRIARHLTDEERVQYLSGSYVCRIFNLWKPLVEYVEDNPLGLCDPRSVSPNDILEVDRVTEEWAGEIYYIKHNPKQKWRYLSRQRKNEVCAFVSFDSRMGDQLNFCPHASFVNLLASEGAPSRWSVEIRVITFNRVETGTGAVFQM